MKRNIFLSSFILFCTLLFVGCAKDENTPVLTNVVPSEMDRLPYNSIELIKPGETSSSLLFTITWSETKFYLDNSSSSMPLGPVTYNLEIDKVGSNFKNAQILVMTTALYADIMIEEINYILVNELGAEPNEASNFEMRVVATYGEALEGNVVASSNSLPALITPYFPPKKIEPIYLVGNLPESDTYRMKTYMMYRNSSDAEDYVYTYTGRFDAGTQFKLYPESGLETDEYYSVGEDTSLLFGEEGASFEISAEGYYTVNINIETMSWDIESYDASDAAEWTMLNFVGAFSDWGAIDEPNMIASDYDGHQWSLDIALDNIEYGVKFRTDNSWDNRWCPANPDDTPYGLADFSPTSHDNNINIDDYGLGDYHIRFNDLTGHYVVIKK